MLLLTGLAKGFQTPRVSSKLTQENLAQTQAKKNITKAIKQAAKQLGNRPATCRKYYVHPAIIDAYLDGSLLPTMQEQEEVETEDSTYALNFQERGVLAILEQHSPALQNISEKAHVL